MSNSIEFHFNKTEDSSGYLLWQVTTLWQRKIKRQLDTIDLTHTQFVLLASLAWLSKNQEIVTQIEIANHSKTDRMMVSKVLRTLQEKGFITRKEHQTDTRAKAITLTETGEKILQKALIMVEQIDVDFFSVLQNQAKIFNVNMLTLISENQ
ncbi:MarR family winged helix-turn-helix transcriptional regulator [Arcicella lustrica]|uniref:MarR family transcriptional regulator n=1 Tax=Arcicella lustrica TaxID=2984196 RepID=A0ABU5SHC2_9BACT|nr:MarR family transcriptional regulator [Arcicella sp. DC25W]MEA5426602.1 MarR family transcriptional regulator [Arcicella sp. DC25W]